MKRLLITLALVITTTLAIIAYRDSQIPRATATIQKMPQEPITIYRRAK